MRRTLILVLLSGAPIFACTASDPGTSDSELRQASTLKRGKLHVQQTNLASDPKGVAAAHTVPELINAWGLAIDLEPPSGPVFWIAANGSNSLVALTADGTPTGQTVAVSKSAAPTGLVHPKSSFRGDKLITDTEGSTIEGWQPAFGSQTMVRVDNSESGAVYKGLAVFERCDGDVALAATDFRRGKVDVFDAKYAEIADAGFVDAELEGTDFAPFGIAYLDGEIYISYAKQNAEGTDDDAGPGNGFVDVFQTDGRLARRLISHGDLNSPWGMALVPSVFDRRSHVLLVGNFGDGRIHVYDPRSGAQLGQLQDASGAPLVIDGLWSLVVGPKTHARDKDDRLFFTAGPDHEDHGLFGTLRPTHGK